MLIIFADTEQWGWVGSVGVYSLKVFHGIDGASFVSSCCDCKPNSFAKGSVLDPCRVSSIYELSSAILMLFFIINYLGNKLPSCLSASRYVNSPTRRNPAKAKVNAARRVMLS